MEEQCLQQHFGFGPYKCAFQILFLQHLIIDKSLFVLTTCSFSAYFEDRLLTY